MFHSLFPENVRKPDVFGRFQGALRWNVDIKWANKSNHQEVFCKSAVLRNSGKFTRKYFLIESVLVKSYVVGLLF